MNTISEALTSITSDMVYKAFRLCGTDAIFNENLTFGLNSKLQDVLSCNKIEEDEIDCENLFKDLHD